MHNKALPPALNDSLRAMLTAIVRDDFGGNVSAASRKLAVSHSLVFEFLDGRRGAGIKLASALATYSGKTLDELLGRGSAPPMAVPSTALGARPDWLDIRSETEKRYGARVEPDVLDDVARMSLGRQPEVLLPEDVKRLHDLLLDVYARDPLAKVAARTK